MSTFDFRSISAIRYANDNSVVSSVSTGGTGLTSYVAGDIIFATGPSSLAPLTIGANGQILSVVGGLPAWRSPGSQFPVGVILQSMLGEVQFVAQNGVGWVLMDGRNVVGSAYAALTGNATVPDARGTVLRGKNNARADGFQNPAGDLALGAFENDQFQGHYHSVPDLGGTTFCSGAGPISVIGTNPDTRDTLGAVTDGVNGAPRSGAETRVKAVTINHFIKIN